MASWHTLKHTTLVETAQPTAGTASMLQPRIGGITKGRYLPDAVPFLHSLPGLNVGQSIPEAAAAGVAIPVQGTGTGLQLPL